MKGINYVVCSDWLKHLNYWWSQPLTRMPILKFVDMLLSWRKRKRTQWTHGFNTAVLTRKPSAWHVCTSENCLLIRVLTWVIFKSLQQLSHNAFTHFNKNGKMCLPPPVSVLSGQQSIRVASLRLRHFYYVAPWKVVWQFKIAHYNICHFSDSKRKWAKSAN